MKLILTITGLQFVLFQSMAQYVVSPPDTLLKNLSDNAEFVYDSYTASYTWGNYTSHNYKGIEEYAEKYYIDGQALVKGIVSHHYGEITTASYPVEFCVYDVASNRKPGEKLGSKIIKYGDIDLDGNAIKTFFDEPIMVSDSFFVSFNLFDYFHRPFTDTIGVYYGEHGSRTEEDLATNFGRNVVRKHFHGPAVWVDFYTQNFTPIATHFALFPIIEFVNETELVFDDQDLELSVFPNPAADRIQIEFKRPIEQLTIYNLMGRVMCQKEKFGSQSLDVSDWPSGSYMLKITTEDRTFVKKVIIHSSN
ncbi:MAG: T9SS type A sorting domain-containing protein [Cyclobacteriaceae bacterium]